LGAHWLDTAAYTSTLCLLARSVTPVETACTLCAQIQWSGKHIFPFNAILMRWHTTGGVGQLSPKPCFNKGLRYVNKTSLVGAAQKSHLICQQSLAIIQQLRFVFTGGRIQSTVSIFVGTATTTQMATATCILDHH